MMLLEKRSTELSTLRSATPLNYFHEYNMIAQELPAEWRAELKKRAAVSNRVILNFRRPERSALGKSRQSLIVFSYTWFAKPA